MFSEYEIVSRAKKGCRICGSKDVTWFQGGFDSKKWYLAEVFEIDGETRASKKDFHSKYCGARKKLDHADEQRKITQREQDGESERMELRMTAERKQEEENAEEYLRLASLDPEKKLDYIALLERQMDSFYRNPPTMDYMTEFNAEISAQKERQTMWRFLKALTGDPQEENYLSDHTL